MPAESPQAHFRAYLHAGENICRLDLSHEGLPVRLLPWEVGVDGSPPAGSPPDSPPQVPSGAQGDLDRAAHTPLPWVAVRTRIPADASHLSLLLEMLMHSPCHLYPSSPPAVGRSRAGPVAAAVPRVGCLREIAAAAHTPCVGVQVGEQTRFVRSPF